MAKKYLQYTLSEIHQMFLEEIENFIGLSAFKMLRPPNCLYQGKIPANLCLCLYHENISLLLTPLQKFGFLHDHKTLLKKTSCNNCYDEPTYCTTCITQLEQGRLSGMLNEDDMNTTIEWHQWVKADKVRQEGSINDVLEAIIKKLPHFKKHCYVKDSQSQVFNQMYSDPPINTLVIQVDFSENAEIN